MAKSPPLLLSAALASEIIGISKRMFHNLRKREDFPKPVVLGSKAVRWRHHEIEAWICGLPAEAGSRAEPPQLSAARGRRSNAQPIWPREKR